MNQNQSRNYVHGIIFAFVVTILAVTVAVKIHAQSTPMFLQTSGQVSIVNIAAKSVTIAYPQALAMVYCVQAPCPPQPTGRNPDTVAQDQVLVLDGTSKVIDDITMLKVGDSVVVYLKQNIPYAIKDTNMVTPGCDPVTGVCTGTVTGLLHGGSGEQPPVGPCVQIQTFPPQTICPANIQNDLSLGVRSGEVVTLQTKLQSMGYFPNTTQPTGYFGPVTKQAVVQYQAASGLPQTGYVGPMTRSALGY